MKERDKLKAELDKWRLRCMNADDESNKLMQERNLLRDILEDLDVIMGTALHNGHEDLRQRTKEALQKIGEVKE